MAERQLRFVLSGETDSNFKKALQELQEEFAAWKVVGVSREEEERDEVTVPVGVIKIRFE